MRPNSLTCLLFAAGLAASGAALPQIQQGPGPVVTSSIDEGVQTVESMPQIAPSSTGISVAPGPVIPSTSISITDSTSTTLTNSTTSTSSGTSTGPSSTSVSGSAGFVAATFSGTLVTSLFALCAMALF